MLRILDRYVIKEVITPFFLALILFTFILQVDPLMDVAKDLIEKGVGGWTILRLLATLMPQALGITIPISLLVGLLIGLGRLSADREAVALQACGVSLIRLLRPVGAVVVVGWAVTSYVMIWSIPAGNKRFQEILHDIVTARLETQIKPRVFFEDFANLTLFARDVPSGGGGWRDVFLADVRDPKRPQILLARRGRLNIDTETQRVDFVLEDGSQHRPDADDPSLDVAAWLARLRRHNGELGNLLKNQELVAGIGNAYSDEILWAARIGTFRRRPSLADEEGERLLAAMRETLAWASEEVRRRVPPHFEVQARDFLNVHLKGGQPCPRCGTTLSQVSPGGFVTTWCRSCQP